MIFALFGILSIAVCWKWGDWRHWEKYYPTVLYLLIGDFVVDILMYNKPLWGFGALIERYPFIDIATMLLIYPSTVILYLTWYPKEFAKKIVYILMWVGIYLAIELISYATGGFCYHSGWTIWYSVLFNAGMFPLLALHYKKPLLVWPISVILCFLMLWWFRIPLAR
jgi:hypothetical protein